MKKFNTQSLIFSLGIFFLIFCQRSFAQFTVVIPGSFQSEIGCSGDWMPDCDATRLTESSSGIWEGTFFIPAGNWEYKVTYDNSWNENYGQYGEPGGANMMVILGSPAFVHFTFYTATHLVDLSFPAFGVVLAGSFQNELGCPGDWMPDCFNSALYYDNIQNIWSAVYAIPPGSYEYKITHNNSWDENYGMGGVPGGANIPLVVSGDKKILFRYDPVSHIVITTLVDNSVVLAGDFQSEFGCAGDWQPDCPNTGLVFEGASNLWKKDMMIPAGNWEFKVALDGSWTENYGEGGILNGPNIAITLSSLSEVSFVFNPETHILTYSIEEITVVLPGSFQDELGCAGDWDPACDFTRLTFDVLTQQWIGTFDVPQGYWEYKVAYNNSWTENYGAGGISDGANIELYLETPANITFKYDPQSHLVYLVYNTTGICATAFFDTNVNGYNDEGLPMEGVPFTLTGIEINITQNTGSDGKTCFVNLTPGLYSLTGDFPDSYFNTTEDSVVIDLTQPLSLGFGTVCLGGAGAKGIGFWMNKHGKATFDNIWYKDYILQNMFNLNLRNSDGSHFIPTTYEELSAWMQKSNGANMAYSVSAQLAALYLSVETGLVQYDRMIHTPGIGYMGIDADFMPVYSLVWHTSYQLWMNPLVTGSDSNRMELENLKDLLEQANMDMIFVQLEPCNGTVAENRAPAEVIEERSAEQNAIWPNPSDHHFTLKVIGTDGETLNTEIRVIDINGMQVYSASGISGQEFRFGEGFRAGVYFVEIVTGKNRTNLKVIKK